jgi:hypothetical protein
VGMRPARRKGIVLGDEILYGIKDGSWKVF